jgi:hypothetical protein
MKRDYKKLAGRFHLNPETIKKGTMIPVKSLRTYGLDNDSNTGHQHLIHDFHEVGWPDPMPKPILLKD